MSNDGMTRHTGFLRRYAAAITFVILLGSFVVTSTAHPADNSQARIKVEPRRVEFRLTFNLYTLQQFDRLDVDGDGTITRKELDSAEKALREYLLKHILVTINGEDSDLGEARHMERMWPELSIGPDVVAADYGQRFVDFVFTREWKETIESLWVGYDIFRETGDLHTVQAVFEQDGVPTDVSFSKNEPEFEWATDFADEPAGKSAASRADETENGKSGRIIHPLVIIVGAAAAIGTWLLLGKVKRISRGGFRIGPPPE